MGLDDAVSVVAAGLESAYGQSMILSPVINATDVFLLFVK